MIGRLLVGVVVAANALTLAMWPVVCDVARIYLHR